MQKLLECRKYKNVEIDALGETRKDRVNNEYHQFQDHFGVSSIDAKLMVSGMT